MFSLWCIDWVGSLYANRFLCISVLRVASGPRVLAGRKSALNPTMFYSTDRSKTVVLVLVLLFVAVWFILRGDLFLIILALCILFLYFSILLALQLPRLGKRANFSAFCTFVQFALVWICRFPLPLRVWDGLRLEIVAFPELFSYLFFQYMHKKLCILRYTKCAQQRVLKDWVNVQRYVFWPHSSFIYLFIYLLRNRTVKFNSDILYDYISTSVHGLILL